MIPVRIADELVVEGSVRRIITPPGGENTNPLIAPVESLIRRASDGGALLGMCLELEPGELELLQNGGKVWLTMWGAVVPFNVCVLEEGQVP